MSGVIISEAFFAQLSAEERRRLLAFATEPGRQAFLRRFTSDAEKRAYFSSLGRRSGVARRARAKGVGDDAA